jgi:hypothetical protein
MEEELYDMLIEMLPMVSPEIEIISRANDLLDRYEAKKTKERVLSDMAVARSLRKE